MYVDELVMREILHDRTSVSVLAAKVWMPRFLTAVGR
jgi:hypothetical protein